MASKEILKPPRSTLPCLIKYSLLPAIDIVKQDQSNHKQRLLLPPNKTHGNWQMQKVICYNEVRSGWKVKESVPIHRQHVSLGMWADPESAKWAYEVIVRWPFFREAEVGQVAVLAKNFMQSLCDGSQEAHVLLAKIMEIPRPAEGYEMMSLTSLNFPLQWKGGAKFHTIGSWIGRGYECAKTQVGLIEWRGDGVRDFDLVGLQSHRCFYPVQVLQDSRLWFFVCPCGIHIKAVDDLLCVECANGKFPILSFKDYYSHCQSDFHKVFLRTKGGKKFIDTTYKVPYFTFELPTSTDNNVSHPLKCCLDSKWTGSQLTEYINEERMRNEQMKRPLEQNKENADSAKRRMGEEAVEAVEAVEEVEAVKVMAVLAAETEQDNMHTKSAEEAKARAEAAKAVEEAKNDAVESRAAILSMVVAANNMTLLEKAAQIAYDLEIKHLPLANFTFTLKQRFMDTGFLLHAKSSNIITTIESVFEQIYGPPYYQKQLKMPVHAMPLICMTKELCEVLSLDPKKLSLQNVVQEISKIVGLNVAPDDVLPSTFPALYIVNAYNCFYHEK